MASIFTKLRQKLAPSPFERMVKKFYSDGGEVTLRYDYDLNKNSVVLDLGGFKGEWASKIYGRYGCRVEIFEPVPAFANRIQEHFKDVTEVNVHCLGLGARARQETIWIEGEASSAYRADDKKNMVEIHIVDIAKWLAEANIEEIDLIKLNIEGAEYELLDRMIETGIHAKCRDIQVQFHDLFPDAEVHMNKIGAALLKTHHLTYDYKFVWQNWRRN